MEALTRVREPKLWWVAGADSRILAECPRADQIFVQHLGIDPGVIPLAALATLLVVRLFLERKMEGWAFVMTGLNLVFTQISFFMILYPRVMISSTDPANILTIYNASSSPYTLQVMTVVALIFVPLILVYQGYTYWVFRKRLTAEPQDLTY